jgi:hypothetical protein
MKTLRVVSAWLALGLFLTAEPTAAQGVIGDFLHRLSGPPFLGAGFTAQYTPLDSPWIRLRLTGAYRVAVDKEDTVTPSDASLNMVTIQPAAEFSLQDIPFEFVTGVALHRFGGDADPFWHYSFPVLVQWRPRADSRFLPRFGPFVPRVGTGVHAFPKFDEDAFDPIDVQVSRDDSEAVLYFFIGFDYQPG